MTSLEKERGLERGLVLLSAVDRSRLAILFEVGQHLELDDKVDLSYIERLREVCPNPRGPKAGAR
jgi:hypothetical protein